MSEPMGIAVEVWPVAADSAGLWLLSGNDAWRPPLLVMSDTEPHADVELELAGRGALDAVTLLHSTSWRVDGPRVVLTYIAVIDGGEPVPAAWPGALPISLDVAEAVGPPPTSAATEPPAPRYIDVLMHAVRHLRFLRDHDATANAAMSGSLKAHLEVLRPALAGMYGTPHLTPVEIEG